MAPDDSTPGWSTEDQTFLRTATELLDAGQYEHLAEVLHQVQLAYDKKGDTIPAHVLVLARRICLACSQSQAEADWHQQACEEAAQREDKLRHQLTTLLDLVSEREFPAIPGEWDLLPDATPAVLGPPGPESPDSTEPLSLWQRIQGALRWRLGPQPPEGVASEVPMQGLAPITPETVESRILSATKKDETSAGSSATDVKVPPPEPDEETEIPSDSPSTKSDRPVRPSAETIEVSAPSAVYEVKAPLSPPERTGTEARSRTGEFDTALAHPLEETDVPIPSTAKEVASQGSHLTKKPEEAEILPPLTVEESQEPIPVSVEKPEPPSEPAEEPGVPTAQSIETAEAASPSFRADDEEKAQDTPSLVVHCLGPFRVYQDDQPVEDWPSSKGKSIFKFLVINRTRPVAKEVLMELFWPGAHPDAARNNLNVAIYGLRQALRKARSSFSHVLFQEDHYHLNPDLRIWVDVEAFTEHVAAARDREERRGLSTAVTEYGAAEALYQGEFLEEDRYEDWPTPQRQGLQAEYLRLLERLSHYYLEQGDHTACATVCRKMLAVDACCEEAHRRLMRCYCQLGQHYLALRQYHLCVETMGEQLDLAPAPITMQLYERIRSRELV